MESSKKLGKNRKRKSVDPDVFQDTSTEDGQVEVATVVLKSSEGDVFQVDQKVAVRSKTIKRMLPEVLQGSKGRVKIPVILNVKTEVLAMILEWCEYHKDDPEPEVPVVGEAVNLTRITIDEWDRNFLEKYKNFKFSILNAAYAMEIIDLIEILSKLMAELLRGKTADEMRQICIA